MRLGVFGGLVAVADAFQSLFRRLERTPDDAGGEVEHVDGAEDDAKRGEGGEADAKHVAGEGAEDREELTGESIEAGEADAAHGEEDEEEREHGHAAGEAAELVDVAGGVRAVGQG